MNQPQITRDLSLKALLHALLLGVAAIALTGIVVNVIPLFESVSWQYPTLTQAVTLVTVIAAFWCLALGLGAGRLLCALLLFLCGVAGLAGLFDTPKDGSDASLISAWLAGEHYPPWMMVLLGLASQSTFMGLC